MKYFIAEGYFPFLESPAITKERPILVLTKPLAKYDSLICAFITSKIPTILLESDLVLENYLNLGLRKKSLVRLHKIVTIESQFVTGMLNEISSDQINEIKKKLNQLFSL